MAPTTRLLFLSASDTNASRRLLFSLLERLPDCSLDLLFERRPSSFRDRLKSQRRNIRRNGWIWIVYRAVVALRNAVAGLAERIWTNEPKLLDARFDATSAYPARLRLRIVDDYHSEETIKEVTAGCYDLGVVFGTRILAPELFTLPRRGMLNVHQGLLPTYRGMPPAFWELFNGEVESGVSIHEVTMVLDEGDVVAQEALPISPTENVESVQRRLDDLAVSLIPVSVRDYLDGKPAAQLPFSDKGRQYRAPTVKERVSLAFRRIRRRWSSRRNPISP
jgi:folate-dependent phosphoribosylglycinamide formyltransferase PurN